MKPMIFPPSPALQPYIRHYVCTEMGTAGTWTQADMAPPGFSGLVIIPDEKKYTISVNGEPVRSYPSLAFTGQITRFSDVFLYDKIRIFFVAFNPCGAYRLLGIPQHECTDTCYTLPEMLGAAARRLEEQLQGLSCVQAIKETVERFFLHQLTRIKHKETVTQLAHISEQIRLRSHTNNLISAICRQEGYSISRLERHMKEIIGMSPKKFQRIIRFDSALRYVRQHRHECRWAQVAVQFGYFDQMHFIKEFKLFYGRTPADYDQEGWLMKVIHAV